MKGRDASCTVIAIGLLTLWMALTDAMLKYLKPSMKPWILLAGAGLVGIGVYGLVRQRMQAAARVRAVGAGPDDHGHHHSRVAWFLVVPILVVIAVGTEPLGSYAAGRAGSASLPEYAFDIAGYARGQGTSTPTLQVLDVYLGSAQPGNRQYLLGHDVKLLGFVTQDPTGAAGSFVLNRFLISCCAADATLLSVGMTGVANVPANDQWVEVRARLQPHRVAPSVAAEHDASADGVDLPKAQFRVVQMRHVPAPSNPYEGLR